MTDKIEALREKLHDTLSLIGAYGSVDMHLWDKHCDAVLKSMEALSELDRLRSSNEAMRKALAGSHRLFLPIFMRLAEAELVGEPVKDEAVLFSFMGSGASDHVTVGDFRKAHEAARSALSSLQEEEAQ